MISTFLTAEAIAELKRMDAEATAGPWRASGNLVWRTFRDSQERRCHTPIAEVLLTASMRDGESEANAALFAAARSVLPALLSELEQSRVERKEMMEALETLRSCVQEGGVPRYTVTPGAALNSIIEEVVDPVLSRARQRTQTGG